jgi:hypothetical protein
MAAAARERESWPSDVFSLCLHWKLGVSVNPPCKDETGVSIIYFDEEGLKQHCQYRIYNIINKLSIIIMFAAGINVELIVEKINSIAFFRLKTRLMYIKYFITVRISN